MLIVRIALTTGRLVIGFLLATFIDQPINWLPYYGYANEWVGSAYPLHSWLIDEALRYSGFYWVLSASIRVIARSSHGDHIGDTAAVIANSVFAVGGSVAENI